MKITIAGAGYVGLTFAAVLSDLGHTVWIVRKDKEKNEALKNGKVHIFEPGLEKLVKKGLRSGHFIPTLDYAEAISQSDVVFIAVGTPSLANGEADLSQVFSAASEVAKNLKTGYTVVVNKSTVPPGITKKVETIINQFKKRDSKFDIAFCPEFLREGSAVEDTLHPDRVVIGSENQRAAKILEELHQPFGSQVVVTKVVSAELIKYFANSYLALRIVFVNQIADLCEKVNGDVQEVIEGIGLDRRIGTHYWYPGLGYGGSCFPKDVSGLACFARKKGLKSSLFEKMDKLNRERITQQLEKVEKSLGSFNNKVIGILGLACKRDTDDIRNSPAISFIKLLINKGAVIQAYDPLAMENAGKILDGVKLVGDPYQVAEQADALLILTDWAEFMALDYKRIKDLMRGRMLFDSRNLLAKEEIIDLGYNYLGVGR